MKKAVLPIAIIVLVLCSSFVLSGRSNIETDANDPQWSYNVYEDGQTDDGWYLRISYDCDCDDPVVVKISYSVKYGKNGSIRNGEETTTTLWNRRNSLIIAHATQNHPGGRIPHRVHGHRGHRVQRRAHPLESHRLFRLHTLGRLFRIPEEVNCDL